MRSYPAWPLLRLVLALLLAAALAFGALVLWDRSGRSEPGRVVGVPLKVSLAVDKSIGLNTDLELYDTQARDSALEAMRATGAQWLRQRFPWDRIEPQPGGYDWALWDELVETAEEAGFELVAVLDGAPQWARAAEDAANRLAPPEAVRDFGAFAQAFATRYGDRIDYYQIWDEPNIAPHWGSRQVDPDGYARLLRDAAIQIRAVDPTAVVLTAALAPNVEPGGANMSELLYLDALYQAGAAEWFDVVAGQPYDFGVPAGDAPNPNQLNWKRVGLLREVMEAHGDQGTALWATSFGWSTPDLGGLAAAVETARTDWPWLGPMFWAAWSTHDVHGEYAVTNTSGQPGPGSQVLRSLGDLSTLAWPGVFPADHPSGRYDEGWRVTPLGADISQSGDSLEVHFWGTRLDLVIRPGNYRAFLFVTVDGKPANALPTDRSGQAYVVLYDPQAEMRTVTVARYLDEGTHKARFVAERGWGQWAIVGWTASREARPSAAMWPVLALGCSALLVFCAALVASWRDRRSILSTCCSYTSRYRTLDERLTLGLTILAAVLAYISPGDLLSLAALAFLGLLLLLRPEMGLVLIAFALPFYQPGKLFLGKVFSMVEVLCLLTAAGWALSRLLEMAASWGSDVTADKEANRASAASGLSWIRQSLSRLTALDWGVLALLLLGVASLLWSEHGRVAAREFRTVILGSTLFYALLRLLAQTRHEIWWITDAWVLGAALVALVALLQWLIGRNVIMTEGVWRARAFYGSPNNLALYLDRVLPLGLVLALWGRAGRRRWAYGLAAIFMAFAILLSFSRGAWLLGVPVSLLFVAALRGRRAFLVTIGGLVVAGVLVLAVVGPGRLASLANTETGTSFLRLQLWKSSWAMIREHPILGVGLDNFLYHYRTHFVLPSAWEEFDLSHPHNLLLDLWLRLGLAGVLTLGWLLVAFFRRGWLVYRRLPEVDARVLVLGLMGGMVAAVAHGLVDHSFFLVDLAFSFMLMLALVQMVDSGRRLGTLEGD